ncbi:MAG: YhfC family intramembrane metalloprotease [Deltaproteobacteria bacterium]|nr:MAG: YhfC family intramembrane metalloprotease [Deltaproteobacteria bacterium]
MIAVGVIAIILWRTKTSVAYRWFWVGAGLWTVAVVLKVPFSILVGKSVMALLTDNASSTVRVLWAGLYFGLQSALFEMGLTILAALVWRRLGSDSTRAIAIGLGSGAFEAILLGLIAVVGIAVYLAGVPGTEKVAEAIDAQAAMTPLFWLLPPTERLLTLVTHASSRALVLLGVAKGRYQLVLTGFLLFMALDGSVVACLKALGSPISMWWLEIAPLVFALISLPVLFWCHTRWKRVEVSQPGSQVS